MKKLPEITVKAVVLGILLSVVLAAANAYLGLFAGMTVSASIPAAVISMGILSCFRKSNILENNIVQTAASAGESLAAGVIFTIPALILMGYWEDFNYLEITKISGLGGLIGVLFTIPLRRALIIEAKLKYPEGVATAAVLQAGDHAAHIESGENKSGLGIIGLSALIGGFMKLGQQGFQMWHAAVEGSWKISGALFGVGADLSPALISVGYIVGRNISILVLIGGVISWLVAIPVYSLYNGIPLDANIETASKIWSSHIRYIGVGTMVVGGIYSIFQLIKPLIKSIKTSLTIYKKGFALQKTVREDRDIPIKWVCVALILSTIPLFLLYLDVIEDVSIAVILTVVMLIFGFLFSAVAGYMSGLVGSSNNPVSGVTIAAILFTSLLLLALVGAGSLKGAASAIMIGAVVCCAAAIAGDNMQDLKAGRIVGATPWKQQIMQIIGTITAACVLGLTLDILHSAYTIGSEKLSAPQATLMKSIAEGVFKGDLPWNYLIIGALIGVLIIVADIFLKIFKVEFRLHILAVAVGIYLPITLSVPIFIGGMIADIAKRTGASEKAQKRGLLFASGLITGEALMGIIVAIPIFITANPKWWPEFPGFTWLGVIFMTAIIGGLFLVGRKD